jgi:hypothetical protein
LKPNRNAKKVEQGPLLAAFFTFFFVVLSVVTARAQTIRPVISEYTAKVAKGSVELVNPGLVPLTVVVEPKSFSVSESGDITYRPLDKGIQLKLSAMSFKIPPQQSYFIFYEAKSETLPAWFVIYANIGGFKTNHAGMNLRLDLPHTVYILPKHSVERSDLLVSSLGPSATGDHMNFLVTNSSPWFGRALSTEIADSHGTTQGSGFPIFPNSRRIVQVPCSQTATSLRLRLKNFKVEAPVSEHPAPGPSCAP